MAKPVRLDSIDHVTGTVPYTANLNLPEMLYAKVLRSWLPHARIARIDTSRAEQLPGVVAILTAADLDQPGGPTAFYGVQHKDQPIVAKDKVRYIGEPVAIVATESIDIAEVALQAIDVEFEELPAFYNEIQAMQPGAPVLHEAHSDNCFRHAKLRHGDIEAGFAAADEIIEETYLSPTANHVTLEPHVTAAQWQDGKLTIWSATQAPSLVQQVIAEIFNLEPEAVRVMVAPLGGGYGGKGHIRLEPIVAALAWKVNGRPVKLTLTRAETFVTVNKHAATIHIKSGVKRDGTLTARQVTIHWNGGAYADVSPSLVGSGMLRSIGPYRIPAVQVDSYGVYTNLPPAAAFRGAMASQGTWAYESHTDSIAHRLSSDPLAFRQKNVLVSGDTFATGETLHDIHFVECLEAVASGIGWNTPLQKSSGVLKCGRGLAVMMKSTIPNSKSQCRLLMDVDGQVTLFTSTVEMGQGAHTALAQIAAESLGVPVAAISVVGPDTAQNLFDTSTNASRSTFMMGNAIINAATLLKQKLTQAAVPLLEYPPEELSVRDGVVCVTEKPELSFSLTDILRRNQLTSLDAIGEFQTRVVGIDPETGQGVSTPHWHQGAGACEVEIDTETGKVTILRYWSAAFAGRVVNPELAKLQNDGNVIYGIGPALLEEVIFDNGQIANPNLSDYNIPAFLDIPRDLNSVSLEGGSGEFHGIGEMTLPPVAPAIANAIYDALGIRIYDLPITAEKVLRALQNE